MSFDYNPVLHTVRCPIEMLNIMGAGGLQMNSLVEVWGDPLGGKSTLCYQTAGMFLQQYGKDAEVLILDAEASANLLRLDKVFGLRPGWREVPGKVDGEAKPKKERKDGEAKPKKARQLNLERIAGGDPRVLLCRALTVEAACFAIIKRIREAREHGRVLLVVWDSVTQSHPEAEYEEIQRALSKDEKPDAYVEGQMLKPRIVSAQLMQVMSEMWYTPVTIFLINQKRTKPGRYGAVDYSAGGNAKFHDVHYRIKFDSPDNLFKNKKEPDHFVLGSLTSVTVEKSKNTPRIVHIPVTVRDTQGGLIDPNEELLMMADSVGFFTAQQGGWYVFSDEFKRWLPDATKEQMAAMLTSKFQKHHLREAPAGLQAIRIALIYLYRSKYFLVDEQYKALEALSAPPAKKAKAAA